MSRPTTYTNSDLALAYELRQEGIGWKAIARALGVEVSTLQKAVYHAIRHGLK